MRTCDGRRRRLPCVTPTGCARDGAGPVRVHVCAPLHGALSTVQEVNVPITRFQVTPASSSPYGSVMFSGHSCSEIPSARVCGRTLLCMSEVVPACPPVGLCAPGRPLLAHLSPGRGP